MSATCFFPLQFDYESFVYDCFENGDKFPVLESLVIRNLKLSTNGQTFDNCKCMHNVHAM